MSRRSRALLAGLAALASLGALIWAAGDAGTSLRPLRFGDPALDRDLDSVAKATFGRRVLLIDPWGGLVGGAGPEDGRSRARLLETGRSGGWRLFDGLPPGSDDLRPAVEQFERDVAEAYDRRAGFGPRLRERLVAFGVAEVAVHVDGRVAPGLPPAAGSVQDAETLEIRAYSNAVQSFPVYGAEPVFELRGGGLAADGTLPALTPAPFLDYDDALWGGKLTVEVAEAGDFLFPWPAEGAHVTVDGAPVAGRALDARLPLLVVSLPAGAPRVSVAYLTGGMRSKVALFGAAGLVLSLLALLIAIRTDPNRDDADDDADLAAYPAHATPGPPLDGAR